MSSFKVLFVLSTISVFVIAAPNSREDQLEGMQKDQGSFGGQNGFGGNQGSFEGLGRQGGNQGSYNENQGNFGGPQGGFGGPGGQDGHRDQGYSTPPFLRNVSEQARQEYMAIVTNSSLTISEIEQQSSQWAQTNRVSEQYEQFTGNITDKLEEMKQNITIVLNNLSSVLNSLESILENNDQTLEAQREAIENLTRESPKEVATLFYIAQNLASKPQDYNRHNGSHGSHGGQGGSTQRPIFSSSSTTTTPSG